MIGMRKKSGQLITLRHIFCIEKLINMNNFLSALLTLGPDPPFLQVAFRAKSFMKRLFIPAKSMVYAFF